MGLFSPSRIRITPTDFANTQLSKIFSSDFVDAETKGFASLLNEASVFQRISLNEYLRERQNVICHLFQIAWDRTVSTAIFIEYASVIRDDPRVQAIDTGVYDRALSRAQ